MTDVDLIRAARARYRQSEAGKTAKARYRESETGKAAKTRYRVRYRAERKAFRRMARERKRKVRASYPFVGCDGEGITAPDNPDGSRGRHSYALFRMGDRELFRDGERLTTGEILAFILDHPRKTDILVGFAFEYDITSILVDLPDDRRRHLMETYQQLTPVAGAPRPSRPKGFSKRWTWATLEPYGTFGLNWLSRNHLSVCRPHPRGVTDPKFANASDRKSIRTIYDVFGFFQTKFVDALKDWEIGADFLASIEAMKSARASFTKVTPEIRSYNRDECLLLGEAMEKFRSVCLEIDIAPRTWNGAGKIASFLHRTNETTRKKDLEKLLRPGLLQMAHAAYYGGRFEVTRVGHICEEVYEHDINSAYPAMMKRLPCLEHGKWVKTSGEVLRDLPDDAIFVCPIRFTHHGGCDARGRPVAGEHQFLCGLPFRSPRDGRLLWPREARGVYWSPEIRSAERLGASCAYGAGWLYVRQCTCKPFAWVETLYRQRKELGPLKGKPIKLGINALYGKLAQRIGEPQYANPVWAGLVTAMTRALLNDAIVAVGQRHVVMIATDAIYTVRKPVPGRAARPGDGLGEWTVKSLPSIFICQPGLYWTPDKVKSRGISAGVFRSEEHDYTLDLEAAWQKFAGCGLPLEMSGRMRALRDHGLFGGIDPVSQPFPSAEIKFPAFVGLRLAGHWGKPELAGQWLQQTRTISFDWRAKRNRLEWSKDRRHAIVGPIDGDPSWISAHYEEGGTLSTSEGWEVERMLLEAMPDYVAPSDLSK